MSIIPESGYPIYESQINYQGGVPIPYRYYQTKNGFNIDLENIAKLITSKTKILILNNYQNPMSASSGYEIENISSIIIKARSNSA